MRASALALLALVLLACGSDPVDCYKVPPSDCDKHSECLTVWAGRRDPDCSERRSPPLACWPVTKPLCEMMYYLQDPNGTCWGFGDCLVPAGWTDEDGSCTAEQEAIHDACFPRDGGTKSPTAGVDGGSR